MFWPIWGVDSVRSFCFRKKQPHQNTSRKLGNKYKIKPKEAQGPQVTLVVSQMFMHVFKYMCICMLTAWIWLIQIITFLVTYRFQTNYPPLKHLCPHESFGSISPDQVSEFCKVSRELEFSKQCL